MTSTEWLRSNLIFSTGTEGQALQCCCVDYGDVSWRYTAASTSKPLHVVFHSVLCFVDPLSKRGVTGTGMSTLRIGNGRDFAQFELS